MAYIIDQQAEFASRLQRIAERARNHTQTIFVGEDEVYDIQRGTRKSKPSSLLSGLGNAFYPVSLALAVVLGALSHAMGMVLRFHVKGLKPWSDSPDIEMLVQIVLGFCLALVLGHFLRLRSTTHTPLKLFGAGLGVLLFHNAVHQWPELFASLTSPLWVSKVCAVTKAHSLLWRGISFPF